MSEQNNSTTKNIFAILGFIILLAIGVWSAIQVIKFVPRLFSDSGVATQVPANSPRVDLNGRDIAVEMNPEVAQSGSPVTLEWAHTGDKETGVVSFSYACVAGFYFEIAGRPAPCNAPYNLPADEVTLAVTPLSAQARTEVPLAITYTDTKGVSIRDTKTLIVENTNGTSDDDNTTTGSENNGAEGSVVGTDTEKEGTTRTPIEPVARTQSAGVSHASAVYTAPQKKVVHTIKVPRQSDPYGTADLHVQMLAIGEVNQYGAFEHKHVVSAFARGGAKFKVTNHGTKATGPWYFSAILPTQGGYPYNSGPQPSLNPGSSTEIFLTFDQLVPGVHYFDVTVDPQNFIQELSETNNRTNQGLTVTNY